MHVKAEALIPVHRGIYVPGDAWTSASPDARYLAKIRGVVQASAAPAVISHLSVAAMHELPLVRPWPERVHVLTPGALGGSSSRLIRSHREIRPVDTEVVDGITVTSLPSTLADVAIAYPLDVSVPMLDHALHRAGDEGRAESLMDGVWIARHLRGRVRGGAQADRAISFASRLAESPGESLSRVLIQRGGFARPDLQRSVLVEGRRNRVDFAWPGVIGEFDGRVKYLREQYRGGRTPDRVAWDEKRREDAIRMATGCTFVRWGFEELHDPIRLWNRLNAARVPRPHPPTPLRARPNRSGTPS